MFEISLAPDELDLRDIVHTISKHDVKKYVYKEIVCSEPELRGLELEEIIDYNTKRAIQELEQRGYKIK